MAAKIEPVASRARRHAAGDEPWQGARVLRPQRDALGQAEAEAGRVRPDGASATLNRLRFASPLPRILLGAHREHQSLA